MEEYLEKLQKVHPFKKLIIISNQAKNSSYTKKKENWQKRKDKKGKYNRSATPCDTRSE